MVPMATEAARLKTDYLRPERHATAKTETKDSRTSCGRHARTPSRMLDDDGLAGRLLGGVRNPQTPSHDNVVKFGSEPAGFMEKLSAGFSPFPKFTMTTCLFRNTRICMNYEDAESFSYVSSRVYLRPSTSRP